MEITFYGTRGSTPVSGRDYFEYGGNTTCIALDMGERLMILDCGTGLQALQKELFSGGEHRGADIFISHLHWDHIQGIAFFTPFFAPSCEFELYGEARYGKNLRQHIESIMASPLFPVEADAFLSKMSYRDFTCGDRLRVGGVTVDTVRLDHPDFCTGYRFQKDGKAVCIVGDCENTGSDLVDFARGADILIYDAQYTEEEYPSKVGWGHSTWNRGCEFAGKCRAGKLILTHHDPFRTDAMLNRMQEEAREIFAESVFAYDGMKVLL